MPQSPLDERELMDSARVAHVSSRQQQQHDVAVNGARATGSAREPRSGKDTRRARRWAAFHVSFGHSSFVAGKPQRSGLKQVAKGDRSGTAHHESGRDHAAQSKCDWLTAVDPWDQPTGIALSTEPAS